MKLVTAGTALLLVVASVSSVSAEPATQNPLDEARAAAERLSFVGVVDVRWSDGAGTHNEQLAVRGASGSLEVQGTSAVMAASGGDRMVRRPGGDWDLLWTGSQAAASRPDVGDKYRFVPVTDAVGPVTVASRAVRVVEVREHEALRERLYLDTATGMLLRLDQLEADGVPSRTVSFSAFQIDPATAPPQVPARHADHSPRPLVAAGSPTVPEVLAGGYRRMGAYREPGAVQVIYNDGLYDLSVFQQPGGLRTDGLPPAGRRIAVKRRHGWAYGWAGGHVLVLPAGRTVYSLVSDAPVDQLTAAAASLPATDGSPSMTSRLRRACGALLRPLAT
ncbi:MAG: sigma-E factor regulatory protein RseB domain-containing protein [Acidimicrobiales bacterium]